MPNRDSEWLENHRLIARQAADLRSSKVNHYETRQIRNSNISKISHGNLVSSDPARLEVLPQARLLHHGKILKYKVSHSYQSFVKGN